MNKTKLFDVCNKNRTIKYDFFSYTVLLNQVLAHAKKNTKDRLPSSDFSKFEIVTRELLNNALEHGNHKNSKLVIQFSYQFLKNNQLKITVKDQGIGFDFSHLKLEAPINPKKIKNRGLYLVKSFSKKLKFNKEGNKAIAYIELEDNK